MISMPVGAPVVGSDGAVVGAADAGAIVAASQAEDRERLDDDGVVVVDATVVVVVLPPAIVVDVGVCSGSSGRASTRKVFLTVNTRSSPA